MDEKLEKAIDNLLAQIRTNIKADEVLKYTQAALNLAHAKQILDAGKRKPV